MIFMCVVGRAQRPGSHQGGRQLRRHRARGHHGREAQDGGKPTSDLTYSFIFIEFGDLFYERNNF